MDGLRSPKRIRPVLLEWQADLRPSGFLRDCSRPHPSGNGNRPPGNLSKKLCSARASTLTASSSCTISSRDLFCTGLLPAKLQEKLLGTFDTMEEAEDVVIAKRNELFTHNDLDRGQQ